MMQVSTKLSTQQGARATVRLSRASCAKKAARATTRMSAADGAKDRQGAKAVAAGVASTLLAASQANAAELNQVYGDLASDNRIGILAFLVAPALGWTLFNSFQ